MTTLGMVGEPATFSDLSALFVAGLGLWALSMILIGWKFDEILRELRKQSEGKGKDGGKS